MLELAYASSHASGDGQSGGIGLMLQGFIPFLLILAVFYFLLIRPQQQQRKKDQEMMNSLKTGDQVLTRGGIYGIIVDFGEDNRVKLKIAENVKIDVARSSIAEKAGPWESKPSARTGEAKE